MKPRTNPGLFFFNYTQASYTVYTYIPRLSNGHALRPYSYKGIATSLAL